MKVLVTGGAGFVGSRTTIELRRRGHDVLAIGRSLAPPDWMASYQVIYTAIDLMDREDILRFLRVHVPDGIIHLAWYTEPQSYLTDMYGNLTSLAASLNLLAAAAAVEIPHVVLGGTCLEDADVTTEPIYARLKRTLHRVAEESFASTDVRVTCAHIFSAYGPGEHPDRAIPSIIRAVTAGHPISMRDERSLREYVHVDDVASALATIMETGEGGRFDICTGSSQPLGEVFSLLAQILGDESLVRFDAVSPPQAEFDVRGNPGPLRRLGWSPGHTLETGLRSTVEWWRSTEGTQDVREE